MTPTISRFSCRLAQEDSLAREARARRHAIERARKAILPRLLFAANDPEPEAA